MGREGSWRVLLGSLGLLLTALEGRGWGLTGGRSLGGGGRVVLELLLLGLRLRLWRARLRGSRLRGVPC